MDLAMKSSSNYKVSPLWTWQITLPAGSAPNQSEEHTSHLTSQIIPK